ncbi:MAG: preprotein translocase subunit SecE [Firmicutes bacterium]|nr:preprotein translocase subunit SecE [Bacillota bacterium]
MANEKKKGGLKEYLKGVKTEMKKVVWPTKKELGSYTCMVLIACALFAVGFWILDSIFAAGLGVLFGA